MERPPSVPPLVAQTEEDDMAAFLYQRGTGWYFRRRIPTDLQQYFPSKSKIITRTLETTDKRLAKSACRTWAVKVDNVFAFLKSAAPNEIKQAYLKAEIPEPKKTPVVAPAPTSPEAPHVKTVLLSELIEQYISHKRPHWSLKTRQEIEYHLNLSVLLMGDLPLNKITYKEVESYRDRLQQVPTNFSRLKKYKTKTMEEILAMPANEKEAPDPKSVNKSLQFLSTVLAFGTQRYKNLLTLNPAIGVTVKVTDKKKASEERDAYSAEDIQDVINHLVWDCNHPSRFFIPLIAIFTGMRRGEIAQLYTTDIVIEDGLLCIDINAQCDSIPYTTSGVIEMLPEKKTKKDASRRLIPIHPLLLDYCGFQGYVEECKIRGDKRIFWDLAFHRDGYGTSFSKWFDRKLGPLIAETGSGKSFHSFRHSFMDWFKQNEVGIFDNSKATKILKEIVGHAHNDDGSEDLTEDRYGKRYRAKISSKLLFQLDYGLDLHNITEQIGHFQAIEVRIAQEAWRIPGGEYPTLCEDER
jgi:integrase